MWWLRPKALRPPSAKITNVQTVQATREFPVSLSLQVRSSTGGCSVFMCLSLCLLPLSPVCLFWCSELYLAHLSRNGACQRRKPWRPREAGRRWAAASFEQTARQTATQTMERANQRDLRRQAEHALELCHEHTHANHTHTQREPARGWCYNYADDIHLMIAFPWMQAWEIIPCHMLNNSS